MPPHIHVRRPSSMLCPVGSPHDSIPGSCPPELANHSAPTANTSWFRMGTANGSVFRTARGRVAAMIGGSDSAVNGSAFVLSAQSNAPRIARPVRHSSVSGTMASSTGATTDCGLRLILSSSGSSHPSLSSAPPGRKTNTSPTASAAALLLAAKMPRPPALRRRAPRTDLVTPSSPPLRVHSRVLPQSARTISASSSGGVRCTMFSTVRSSADSGTLWKCTMTEARGNADTGAYFFLMHPSSRVS
mmetsp:Transcript_15465/g.40010  ORF Transcript_15465/g.40010 Transcript_15465/m.40010 type:complete len:245 (-) Transcript_15465:337-1071(-)